MPKVTLRQLEALRYVYFYGLTQAEAGERMGITKQAVSRLILRIYLKTDKARPLSSTSTKNISFADTMSYKVKRKF
jgi:DNA-directed RNA polymerase specialized sigma24 family protein